MDKHPGGRPRKAIVTTNELNRLFYSVDEAAEILSLHPNTIRTRVKAGDIEAYQIGRVWRIPKEVLEYKPKAR